jgi:hypothetical protein
MPSPNCFKHGKETRDPFVQKDGYAPGPIWTGKVGLAPALGPGTIKAVTSRYTDHAIRLLLL